MLIYLERPSEERARDALRDRQSGLYSTSGAIWSCFVRPVDRWIALAPRGDCKKVQPSLGRAFPQRLQDGPNPKVEKPNSAKNSAYL